MNDHEDLESYWTARPWKTEGMFARWIEDQ